MAKIAYVEKENLPENLQVAYDGLQQKFGVVPNVIKAMANAPELLSGFKKSARGAGRLCTGLRHCP